MSFETFMMTNMPLHTAACGGDVDTVNRLLDEGANIEERDGEGSTPLAAACYGTKPNVIRLLVERGCDVNNGNDDFHTPLHYCCFDGNKQSIKLLLQHGADIDAQSYQGTTPLMGAVQSDDLDTVKLLVEENADLEVPPARLDERPEAEADPDYPPCPFGSEEKSPLWKALDQNSPDIFLFLTIAGYNYLSEEWIYKRRLPPRMSEKLMPLFDRYLSGPPTLQVLTRRFIRQHTKSISRDLKTVINSLDIPIQLKQYLLLCDLV